MTKLASGFYELEKYTQSGGYALLPMKFLRLDAGRQVVTNVAGEHVVLADDVLQAVVRRRGLDEKTMMDLESRHLISRGNVDTHVELLAAQLRTKQSRLPDFTALHIFVVTLRCDHTCQYCQVSRVSEDRAAFDMSQEAADRAVDLIIRSPSQALKVEFQGGEALLNFPLIQHIVRRVEREIGGSCCFICDGNGHLTQLTDEMLIFFAEHRVAISTSLDGPETLHNRNRPRPGHDSYARAVAGIERCKKALGTDSVSALMTCTSASLEIPEAIIDEYVQRGFREIFLRPISPYGFAVQSAARIGYEVDRFLEFYQRGLAHVIKLNQRGTEFREVYSSLLLRRMLTSFATGYVDLQSPAGMGLGVLVYNYDGDIYASDEGRMLAEMNNHTFRLGNVMSTSWDEIFLKSPILDDLYRTMNEGMPGCSECAFQPWCGSDPVFHHATQGDMVGHRPTSSFCRRNMEMMRHLVRLLEGDADAAKILRRWAV